MLRSRIYELKSNHLVDGAVLTYHFGFPLRSPTDSLYLCLNVLSVSKPEVKSLQLSEANIKEIPNQIKDIVKLAVATFDNPFLDRLEIFDYEVELMCNNSPFDYSGASIDNIIGFASEGTQTALEILDDARTKRKIWKNDKEIATEINQLVNIRLR